MIKKCKCKKCIHCTLIVKNMAGIFTQCSKNQWIGYQRPKYCADYETPTQNKIIVTIKTEDK